MFHYSKRQFASDILSQCENPDSAFENWMERDAQFANIIFDSANKLEMKALRVDGNLTIEEMVAKVKYILDLLRMLITSLIIRKTKQKQ